MGPTKFYENTPPRHKLHVTSKKARFRSITSRIGLIGKKRNDIIVSSFRSIKCPRSKFLWRNGYTFEILPLPVPNGRQKCIYFLKWVFHFLARILPWTFWITSLGLWICVLSFRTFGWIERKFLRESVISTGYF